MSHTFSWKNGGLYWVWSGTLDTDGLIKANSQLVGRPEYEKIKFIIWDSTWVDKFEDNGKLVQLTATFATQANRYNKNVKVAFVAQNKRLIELIEQYIQLSEEKLPHTHGQQRLFMSTDEAQAWVDTE